MSIYVVNCYFNLIDTKKKFLKHLRSNYETISPLKHTILVSCTHYTAKDLYCDIAPYIESNDKLLITPLSNYFGWLDNSIWTWIKNPTKEKVKEDEK